MLKFHSLLHPVKSQPTLSKVEPPFTAGLAHPSSRSILENSSALLTSWKWLKKACARQRRRIFTKLSRRIRQERIIVAEDGGGLQHGPLRKDELNDGHWRCPRWELTMERSGKRGAQLRCMMAPRPTWHHPTPPQQSPSLSRSEMHAGLKPSRMQPCDLFQQTGLDPVGGNSSLVMRKRAWESEQRKERENAGDVTEKGEKEEKAEQEFVSAMLKKRLPLRSLAIH